MVPLQICKRPKRAGQARPKRGKQGALGKVWEMRYNPRHDGCGFAWGRRVAMGVMDGASSARGFRVNRRGGGDGWVGEGFWGLTTENVPLLKMERLGGLGKKGRVVLDFDEGP